jgi:hypothetical protein
MVTTQAPQQNTTASMATQTPSPVTSQSESFCYTYVGELKMAAPSEEKLICDKFNLEALIVNQVKVSKLWQTGKMFSLEPKREVANRCHMGGIARKFQNVF